MVSIVFPVACTVVADGVLAEKPSDVGGGAPGATANGLPCADGATCESGSCADGVCCATACDGVCEVCNAPGSQGTCAVTPGAQDACEEGSACNQDGRCVRPVGDACTDDDGCASNLCVDDVCCDRACDGACESCRGDENAAGVDGVCGPTPGEDYASECPSGGCVDAELCCGDSFPPTGQDMNITDPPTNCSGGECTVACLGTACRNTVTCPPGYDCVVDCTAENDVCRGATIQCPDGHSCRVRCGGSGHKCEDANISCGTAGACEVLCGGGDTCRSTTVTCGANACDVTCEGGDKPTVDCGDSCDCAADCPIP